MKTLQVEPLKLIATSNGIIVHGMPGEGAYMAAKESTYGETHSLYANDWMIRTANGNNVLYWDESAGSFTVSTWVFNDMDDLIEFLGHYFTGDPEEL